jgi:transposase
MTTLESKTPKTNVRPNVTLNPATPGAAATASAPRPRSLSQAVQAVVRAVDESTLRLVARRDAGLAYQPKTLLALLTYCYAQHIYGSEDVEDRVRRDGKFGELCQNEFPGARVFRHFRRENREALHHCLLGALRFLADQKVETGIVTAVKQEHLSEEATRRITMAMFIDRMELDEV